MRLASRRSAQHFSYATQTGKFAFERGSNEDEESNAELSQFDDNDNDNAQGNGNSSIESSSSVVQISNHDIPINPSNISPTPVMGTEFITEFNEGPLGLELEEIRDTTDGSCYVKVKEVLPTGQAILDSRITSSCIVVGVEGCPIQDFVDFQETMNVATIANGGVIHLHFLDSAVGGGGGGGVEK